jgi:trigger factor
MTTVNENEDQKVETVEKEEDIEKKAAKPAVKKRTKKADAPSAEPDAAEEPETGSGDALESDALVEFTIEVKNEEIEKTFNDTLLRYAVDFKLPGFRKGKAPIEVVKARLSDAVRSEVIEKMINDAFIKKVETEKIKVISRPEVKNIDYEEGKDLKAIMSVEVLPETTLPDFESMEIEIPSDALQMKPYDEQDAVARVLQSFQRQVPVTDREIKEDDLVMLKYQSKILKTRRMDRRKSSYFGVKNDRPFEIIDLYNDIVGKKIGDKFQIIRKYPDDYQKKIWAGQEIEHYIEIENVYEMVTPELDEKFLKARGFNDEAEFKKKLKEDYEAYGNKFREDKKTEIFLEKLVGMVAVTAPRSLVEQEMAQMIQRNPYEFSVENEEDEMKVLSRVKTNAENAVHLSLIIEAVREKFEVKVTGDELETAYRSMAEQNRMDVKEVRKFYMKSENKQHLEESLLRKKVIDILKEKIKIKEV